MLDDHPINNLQISLDVLDCLLAEFDDLINSKRLKSQITTVGELIRVLWNRNLFYSDENTKNHIFKYITCNKQKDIIQQYIASLIATENFNGSQNVYAQIRNQQIEDRRSSSCIHQTNQQQHQRSLPVANSHEKTSENDRRHEIFKIVCDNIEDWRDFGRCLDITEGDLKGIGYDQSLNNNIKLMTNRVLEQAEQQFGNRFKEKLCNALIETRRRDILRKLNNLNL